MAGGNASHVSCAVVGFLIAVLVLIDPSPALAAASGCAVSTKMIFKRVADPSINGPDGLRSYITTAGAQVRYTVGVPLPTIVIQLRAVSATGLELGFDTTQDGSTIQATVNPALVIGGSAALVNRGEAIFAALTIEQVSVNSVLTFTLVINTADGPRAVTLTTDVLVSVPAADSSKPSTFNFQNSGFFTRTGVGRSVPLGVPLPRFGFIVYNSIGYPIPFAQPIVTVTSDFGKVSPTVLTTLNVNNLTVTRATQPFTLTFTARIGSWSSSAATGILNPAPSGVPNSFMFFNSLTSFIAEENIGNTAVLGISLPAVVINLYTSDFTLDTTNTGLVITASCSQAALTGAEALVIKGVATFNELAFVDVAPTAAVIIFTAGNQGNVSVLNALLSSGAVAVSNAAVKAKHLRFSPWSDLGALTSSDVYLPTNPTTSLFTVPLIKVQLMDSAYRIDPSADGVQVVLSSVPDGAAVLSVGSNASTSVRGVAVFSNLQFTAFATVVQFAVSSSQRTSITSARVYPAVNPIGAASDPGAVANAMIASCVTATSCDLSLAFAANYGAFSSFVYVSEQQTVTTLGATLPTIVVELRDQFGVVNFPDGVAPPDLQAFTGTDPGSEPLLETANGATYGKYRRGRYYFSCLQFAQLPTGLVRIQFMPIDPKAATRRYLGMIPSGALRTGFITVAATATGNYAFRLATTMPTAIAFDGQSMTAVLGVALPTITFEFLDSLGNPDTTDSSSQIVASSSSAQLDTDGATVAVSNGVAVFQNLRFTSLSGQLPVLTFTVAGSATLGPVIGDTLSSGTVYLTPAPVAAVDIDFLPWTTPHNNVTRGFQSFSFKNASDIFISVTIVVVDSARQISHGIASSTSPPIVITPSSDEAVLQSPAGVTLDPACDCANFTISIARYVTDYMPAFVKFTVTSGPGMLLGQWAVVGPITVTELQSRAGCSSNLQVPAVIGEFRVTPDVFKAAGFRNQLGELLGVESTRVQIDDTMLKPVARKDHTTLVPWSGTKATIRFLEPLTTSTNRKSSAELAAEFVSLRPGCDAQALKLAAAYFQSADRSCDPVQFQAAKLKAEACDAKGEATLCECYASFLINVWGQVCSEEPTLQAVLVSTCNKLNGCGEAVIQGLCDTILVSQPINLVPLWGSLGGLGGILIIGVVLKVFGVLRSKPKVLLD